MTPAQKKVIEAMKQFKKDGGKEFCGWQSLIKYGITGRAQAAMDALVKKGHLIKNPNYVGYKLAE